MGFQEVWIKLQLLQQKVLNFPWVYDKEERTLKPNPALTLRQQWRRTPLWFLTKYTCLIFLCFSIYHSLQQPASQKRSLQTKIEMIYHIIVITICTQFLVTVYTIEKNPEFLIWFMNSIFKLDSRSKRDKLNVSDKLETKVAYGIASLFAAFPFLAFLAPIIAPYDPVNVILTGVLPDVYRHVIASCFFVVIVSVGAILCTSVFLISATFASIFGKCTFMNLISSKTIDRNFNEVVFKHLELYWLMNACNEIFLEFGPAITGNSIVLCIGLNCIIIALTRIMQNAGWLLFVVGCSVAVVCIYLLIFVLGFHASRPITNSANTIWWLRMKAARSSKIERRKVRCLRPNGFSVGPFFQVKKRFSLEIMSTILNYTITFVIGQELDVGDILK